MATIFRALPDKTMYPDYYEAIPEPQSIDGVKVGTRTQLTLTSGQARQEPVPVCG